ncbi:MAG: hypothetical protein ABWZ87_06110 [Aeromicrobium sp.]
MRAMLTWIAPAVATFAAWWIFFGMDADDNYTVPQAAGLVIVLLAIGVACGWIARAMDLLPFVVSAVMGISAACWTSWSDDVTGTFGVGWIMITAGAALGATVVIVGTWAVRQAVRPSA